MSQIDDIKFFRDLNKNPDWESEISRAETEREKEADAAAAKKRGKSKEKEAPAAPAEKRETPANDIVANYQRTIELVNDFSLKKEFKNDAEGERLIANRKEAVLNLLRKILGDVEKYIAQVNSLRLSRLGEYADAKSYRDTIGSSDAARYSAHNILISDIKLAMRLANVSFNADFPEARRIEEEKRFSDLKGLSEAKIRETLAQRNFVRFPYGQGVFIDWAKCPKDPIGEREFIADWAFSFYDSLSKLEEELDQEIKRTSHN